MIAYKKGYKYQLAKDYICQTSICPQMFITSDFIHLGCDGKILIRKGYAWDGASGPAIDTKNFMRGSLLHDSFYQLMREEKLSINHRSEADKELHRICIEDGMSKLRAWWVYAAVKNFAKRSATSQEVKKLYFAP